MKFALKPPSWEASGTGNKTVRTPRHHKNATRAGPIDRSSQKGEAKLETCLAAPDLNNTYVQYIQRLPMYSHPAFAMVVRIGSVRLKGRGIGFPILAGCSHLLFILSGLVRHASTLLFPIWTICTKWTLSRTLTKLQERGIARTVYTCQNAKANHYRFLRNRLKRLASL